MRRRAQLEGHHARALVDAGVLDAVHHVEAALVGLHRVAAEVDDVLRVLETLRLPLGEAFGVALGLVAAVVEVP